MNRTSKMDLHGARTATDIERKYNFGKSFAEVMGIATDAQSLAQSAAALDENLTAEEIFNRLTNNGEAQGIFRGDDGEIYINADYIESLASMFAKDIVMTGTFTNTINAYIVPSDKEIEMIEAHVLGDVTIPDLLIPRYDFNGDGVIDARDAAAARAMQVGKLAMSDWAGAIATPVTMVLDMKNPERAIHFTVTDMWDKEVDGYLGVNFTSARCPATEARIDALEERIKELEAAVQT